MFDTLKHTIEGRHLFVCSYDKFREISGKSDEVSLSPIIYVRAVYRIIKFSDKIEKYFYYPKGNAYGIMSNRYYVTMTFKAYTS